MGKSRGWRLRLVIPCLFAARHGLVTRGGRPYHDARGGRPVLVLDMYEHAYHMDFGAGQPATSTSTWRRSAGERGQAYEQYSREGEKAPAFLRLGENDAFHILTIEKMKQSPA